MTATSTPMTTSLQKIRRSIVIACLSVVSASSIGANAMLPTPEPEMKQPSSVVNSALMDNATQSSNSISANDTPALMNTSAIQKQVNPVQTKTVAALVGTDAQGRTTLQPLTAQTNVMQGDIIEYRTYVTNHGTDRIRSMTIMMSVPKEVQLQGDIVPDADFASIDGTNFSPAPLKGSIDGQIQVIPLKYYKGLRWTVSDLGLNETKAVQYRAVLR